MTPHNFMLSDFAGIFVSFVLFSLIAFLPGYALGWLLDLLRFRNRTLAFQIVMSVPLSIAVGPIFSYFVGRWLSMNLVLMTYGALSLCTFVLASRALRSTSRAWKRPSKAQFQVLGLVAVWLIIAVLSLADLQIGHRLYFSIISLDYAVRTAFTNAISTSGLPAQSPFFFPGHPVALRYHYYWLILPALVQQIGRPLVDARQAFIAGTLWCGIGLISLVALYLRTFSPQGALNISRRTMVGAALLGVTGLDILPTLLMLWGAHVGLVRGVSPSVEWWNNQVDGWVYSMLWEPHYICALIACLMGFLILWDLSPESTGPRRLVAGITAGLAFATAVGSGLYVALVFAMFLFLWTAITLAKSWYRETGVLILSGAVALALSIPFLAGVRAPGSGGSFLQLTVRSFPLGELLATILGFHRPWQLLLADGVLLPVNYFLEFGFFFAAGWLAWKELRAKKRAATRQELAALTMAGVSLVFCTFLKSGVIVNNDLGWRGLLIAQFMLLIWAVDLARVKTAFITTLLVLGVAGVAYDLAILRFFPLLSDAGSVPRIAWLANDANLGERTYGNREAYEWLRARTSAQRVIQHNPAAPYQDTFYGLYANRRSIAEDSACSTVFGGDPRECVPIIQRLTVLFSSSSDSSSQTFELACKSLPVDVFVAKDTDNVWTDRNSWVWTRAPIFANRFVRLFRCNS